MNSRYWAGGLLTLALCFSFIFNRAQAQTCSGGIDSIQDVRITVACSGMNTITWAPNPDPDYSYSITFSGGSTLLGNIPGSVSFNHWTNPPAPTTGDTFMITETCNLGSDKYTGTIPDSVAGEYEFTSDDNITSTGFTPSSPMNPETLVDLCSIQPNNGTVIRPSCSFNEDGSWSFGLDFKADCLDSSSFRLVSESMLTYISCTGSGTAFPPIGADTSGGMKIEMSDSSVIFETFNLKAGKYKAQIISYSGFCEDTTYICNTVGPGTDEPVIACNSKLNIPVDGGCMVNLSVDMILAGTSNPCGAVLMDSLVLKDLAGVRIPTINYPNGGNADTITLPNASDYLYQKLILEVHSTNDSISNTCWGHIILEDKLAPILTCDTSITVPCYLYNPDSLDHITAIDCDPNPKMNLINEVLITDCNLLPDSIIKRKIRTFNAVDIHGNISETCTDTINLKRLDADLTNNPGGDTTGILDIPGLVYPKHFLVNNDPNSAEDTSAFDCQNTILFADADNDSIPDPVDSIVVGGVTYYGAGVPMIDTMIDSKNVKIPFHPSNYINPNSLVVKLLETCKSVATYRDTKYPVVGCVKKIVRRWTISEWVCNQETQREFDQIIEIQDTLGPEVFLKEDMKLTTNQNSCSRRMKIPGFASPPIDNCLFFGPPTKVIVNVKNGLYLGSLSTDDGTFSIGTGGQVYLDLPRGFDTVIYQVFDGCHNVTFDTLIIEIADNTAPVMICKEHVSVGLAGDGGVKVHAASIDNESFDDCAMGDLCVVRMNDLNKFDTLFASNIGGTLPDGTEYIPLDSIIGECGRTFEKSGTTASGVDYIIKADLCTPYIEYCCDDASIRDTVVLRGIDKSGNINECMVDLLVQDKRRPTVHCPPDLTIDCRFIYEDESIFGNVVAQGEQQQINIPQDQILGVENNKSLVDGVWFGNCDVDSVTVASVKSFDQCSAGTISRTFTVTANGFATHCTQTITISREKVEKHDPPVFPVDTTMVGCGLPEDYDPSVTGRPTMDEGSCSLLGDAYKDLTVRFNNNTSTACFKILREWSIIDWCKVPLGVVHRHTQVIKIVDDVAPVIDNGAECGDTTISVISCDNAIIILSQSGSDNCTEAENLIWSVHIDINNDNIDLEDVSDQLTLMEDDTTSIAEIAGTYPIGNHRAIWTLKDQCGNSTVCEQLFNIENNTQPSAISWTSLTGPLSPLEDGVGEIEVWAEEYNSGSSSHSCGYDIIYSFDTTTVVPSKTLTCDEFSALTPIDSGRVILDIYVLAVEIFEKNGVIDTSIKSWQFSQVIFVLRDPQNTCNLKPNTVEETVVLGGNIRTEDGQNIATVSVDLNTRNSTTSALETSTDENGMYAFPSMNLGESYQIEPSLDGDILNGVSTLDLVLIQKQILGLEGLSSPYKLIAADVNNDKIISAIDLIELRKVILDVSDAFTNNTSWRFINADYEFSDGGTAIDRSFPESYEIINVERDMTIDFIGIKTGDVNETVNVTGLITNPRSSGKIRIIDQDFMPGQVVSVPIEFIGSQRIFGFQFGLKYDHMALDFTGFLSEGISLTSANFGTRSLDQGKISTSWNSANSTGVSGNTSFTLEFIANRSGRLSDVLRIEKDGMSPEMYSESLESIGLNLEYVPGTNMSYGEYMLLQNSPNPFSESTSIDFVLPERGQALLSIFDINGKLLKAYSGEYDKGLNTLILSKKELGIAAGVLIFTLESGDYFEKREMIVID